MYNIYSPGSKEFTNSISIKTITVFCQESKLQPTQNICHLLMNMPHVGLLHIPSQRAMPRCTSRCRLSQWGRCLHFFVQLGGTWVTNILLYRCPAVKVSKSHAGSQHQLSLWQETICSLNGGWEHATRLVLQNDRKCSYALARSKDRECWSKSPKKPDCRRKCLGSQVNESRECHSPVPKLEPKKTFEKNTP